MLRWRSVHEAPLALSVRVVAKSWVTPGSSLFVFRAFFYSDWILHTRIVLRAQLAKM